MNVIFKEDKKNSERVARVPCGGYASVLKMSESIEMSFGVTDRLRPT